MSDVNRPIIREIRSIASEMAAEEARLLAERRARADDAYRSAVAGRVGSGIVTSVLLVSLAVSPWRVPARASGRRR